MSQKNDPEIASRIAVWLTKPDYSQGLRIYFEQHGETVLYKMLVLSQNSFNVKKLTEQLRADLDRINAQIAEQLANEPEAISELRKKTGALMDERTALKAQLRVLDDKAVRYPKAVRILAIGEELNRLFAQIEFFYTNNVLWEPETEGKTDEEIQQEYLNLRTYISRARSRLQTAVLPADKTALEKKLNELEEKKRHMELIPAVERRFGTTAKAAKTAI